MHPHWEHTFIERDCYRILIKRCFFEVRKLFQKKFGKNLLIRKSLLLLHPQLRRSSLRVNRIWTTSKYWCWREKEAGKKVQKIFAGNKNFTTFATAIRKTHIDRLDRIGLRLIKRGIMAKKNQKKDLLGKEKRYYLCLPVLRDQNAANHFVF